MNLIARAVLAGMTVALSAGNLLRSRPSPARRRRTPKLIEQALVTGDGIRLPLAVWRPEDPPRAVLVAVHGFGDYRKAFAPSAPLLAARGILVYAYDQRGCGETRTRGSWPGPEDLVRDAGDAVAAARAAHPDLPLVVLGESMGGAVALARLGRRGGPDVDALILAAPGVRGDLPLRQLHDVALRLAALALPWLRVELRRGGRPWLMPEEAERLAEDPLILRRLSVGTYEGLVDLATMASQAVRDELPPTLVLYGALDTTVPRRAIDQLMVRLGSKGTLLEYPDRHHLILHEFGVETVLNDCLDWLERILPAGGRSVAAAQTGAAPANPEPSADPASRQYQGNTGDEPRAAE